MKRPRLLLSLLPYYHLTTPVSPSPTTTTTTTTNFFLAPSGPIQDASCDVEHVELANDSQLHLILSELKDTAFFRNFAVDLGHRCPLSSWTTRGTKSGKAVKDDDGSTAGAKGTDKTTTMTATKDDTPECEGDLPDFEDDHGGGSCGVDTSSDGGFLGGMGSKSSFATSSSGSKTTSSSTTKSNIFEKRSEEEEEDEHACEGDLPDFEDETGGGSCGIDTSGDSGFMGGMGHKSSFTGSSLSQSKSSSSSTTKSSSSKNSNTVDKQVPVAHEAAAEDDDDDDDDDEEHEDEGCSTSEEQDEDDEPLCHIDTTNSENFSPTTHLRDFFSLALNSIYNSMGWESESQRLTFSWNKVSDPVVGQMTSGDTPCADDEEINLPDTFWMDMCSEITLGGGTGSNVSVVNLVANPERNTGYNGTHIWKAIYEENCILVDELREEMCYEERILYRLLSGLHASTTLSIAKNYYPPSKRKGRVRWEANPSYFMKQFESHPERVNNLHFSYVVLLRALQKVTPFLYNYEIKTGNIVDDETATILLRRLLDSSILKSCSHVFSAFDESHMFHSDDAARDLLSLRQNFKGVFHNISSILDCVQCQQCKLHGKMAMLGYGTALKILFLPEQLLSTTSLTRNEIVAFVNTIAKFSESTKEIRELTNLYWKIKQKKTLPQGDSRPPVPAAPTLPVVNTTDPVFEDPKLNLEDTAVALISHLARENLISEQREMELIKLALTRDPDLLILAKHYASNIDKFLQLSRHLGKSTPATPPQPDAIVIGTGLAGLTTTLNILDRGGRVILLEKEHRWGGNSAKASSGINACCPHANDTRVDTGDDLDSFRFDTTKSAGNRANPALIETLVSRSEKAVEWLQRRVGVDLSLVAQLGGHAHKRTHRPNNGMVGAEVIYAVGKKVREYEKKGTLEIRVDTRVTKLLREEGEDGTGRVYGVQYVTKDKSTPSEVEKEVTGTLTATNVVLATGGFASDRSPASYLAHYRPELLNMPATAGDFSTGDGARLATALGAGVVDMDKVQVHPTGWVDPKHPTSRSKILAGELMRGVGGLLLNSTGQRFCNELGTRAYVTNAMLNHDPYHAKTQKWNVTAPVPTFSLVLPSAAAADGKKHVDLYSHKGLLTRFEGVTAVANHLGLDAETVVTTLQHYRAAAARGRDEFGKTSFRNLPSESLEGEVFYVGTVTPVLHYCMGGITIDTTGNVLDVNEEVIPGLHAAGEVSGGVHGTNRLGGNSLLECTVFGTIVGTKLPIQKWKVGPSHADDAEVAIEKKAEFKKIGMEELSRHGSKDDCWVAIAGKVYDLTDFAEEHPPGAESIWRLGGRDGTEEFMAVHNEGVLEDFEDDLVGEFVVA